MTGQARAKALLAQAINADAGSVPDAARIGSLEHWDSLAHLRLLLAIEAAIGRSLDADEIMRIESLDDVATVLRADDRAH